MSSDDCLEDIFLNARPLIDVRAEIEYSQGAFPAAVNLPILSTEERHEVGICYREKGPVAAEQLGHELLGCGVREERVQAWIRFLENHGNAALYCFRGGKRSTIACQWLASEGYFPERIEGGYKRMRRFLLKQFERLPGMIVVSGRTGVGKTRFLKQLPHSLDLEAHARHRGSAFGRRIEEQPSQAGFENAVGIDLLRFSRTGAKILFVEDEGRLIGRIHLPPVLQSGLRRSPLLLLEDSLDHRILEIYNEYIVEQWQQYEDAFQDAAFPAFSGYLQSAMDGIRKRLGGKLHQELVRVLRSALTRQSAGDLEGHLEWIRVLLEQYYDPMYDYQLEKKRHRILFRGSRDEAMEWVKQRDER